MLLPTCTCNGPSISHEFLRVTEMDDQHKMNLIKTPKVSRLYLLVGHYIINETV